MKGSEGKCAVLPSTDETLQVKFGGTFINRSKCEKLLGIKIDHKLTFDEYTGKYIQESNCKLNTCVLKKGA